MPRWSRQEQREIAKVRENLREALASCPQYPEVVGDRKILRFLRGHNHNIEVATKMYASFLKWRKDFGVDAMRENIISGGMDHPTKFPMGELILDLIPALIITHDVFDKTGAPICLDQYKFKPTEVLSKIPLADYITFTTYCLEYRSMIVEQMSEERERAFLDSLTPQEQRAEKDPSGNRPPHGIILGTLVIRDIGGVGIDHCSDKGREIIKAVVKVGSDNYPELLRKCYLVNCPWLFNALWFFIKGLLPQTTLSKISISGHNFRSSLETDLDPDLVPSLIGGPYHGHMEPNSPPPYVWNESFMLEGVTIDAEEKLLLTEGRLSALGGEREWSADSKSMKVPRQGAGTGGHDRSASDGSNRRNRDDHDYSEADSSGDDFTTMSALGGGSSGTKAEASSGQAVSAAGRLYGICVEHPLGIAALCVWCLHFYATEQYKSVLPFVVPIVITWAFLLLV